MPVLKQHLRVPENHRHRLLLRGEMERDFFSALQTNSVMTPWFVCFPSLSAAVEPPRGDRVDADRCADEQYDGENIRPLLRCAHAGSARAGQHRCGVTREGLNTCSTFGQHSWRDKHLPSSVFILFGSLFFPSPGE